MISLVLYGRNDAHGYNLHKRAAISFNCMAEVLTDPDDEILFVDCNTPDDMPTFPEAIQDTLTPHAKHCLRILRLRPALFEQHKRGTRLKVHESLARNIAIRRANPRNRWILSTNTDIVFVPRAPGQSLSSIVAETPDGFYELPRFEIPETLWETLDRLNPQGIMQAFARWGQTLHLNEAVLAGPEIRYDGPGDFQLVVREQIFAVHGFDESMVLGWHVDSNLCKRLYLLNGQTGSLLDKVFQYHCDHTRQATLVHGANRTENDLWRYFENVSSPYLPEQAATWGLPEESIEELRLSEEYVQRFSRALESQTPPLPTPYTESVFTAPTHNWGLWFDNHHVLPFVADHLMTFPPEADIAYFGSNRELLTGLSRFRQAIGHHGRLYYDATLVRLAHPSAPAPLAEGCVAGEAQILFEKAFCFLFDASLTHLTRLTQHPYGAVAEPTEALLVYLRSLHATFINCAQHEKQRQTTTPNSPRKFLLIGSSHTWFETPSQQLIGTTLTPHSGRVRHGYLRDDAFSKLPYAPPLHTLFIASTPESHCLWLSHQVGHPVTPAELEQTYRRLNQLARASFKNNSKALLQAAQALRLTPLDVATAQLLRAWFELNGQTTDAQFYANLISLMQQAVSPKGHAPKNVTLPLPTPPVVQPPAPIPARAQPTPASTPAFHLIGYLSGNLGLGVLARNVARQLQDRGVPFSVLDINPGLNRAQHDTSFAHLAVQSLSELQDGINLFVLPPTDVESVLKALPPHTDPSRRLDALLTMWELAHLPPAFQNTLRQVDVLVAETDFIRQAFATQSNLLTVSATPPLYLPEGVAPNRARFGLPEEALLFITSFEPHSDIQRKNPWAVLAAFQRAFPNHPTVRLVFKLNNPMVGNASHPLVHELEKHCAQDPRILLVAETLSYTEVLSLYASCDAFVSLHRAEGLGLGLMEAMALGKPVIATAWSGNMAFMNHANACPVKYQLIPVEGTIPAYSKAMLGEGALWADPDIGDAAAWMQRLAEDPALRVRIGAKAQEFMLAWHEEARRAKFVGELQAIWEQRAFQRDRTTASTVWQSATVESAPADIVIPIYGQAALLQKCVASVLKTAPNAHLILVDDCSPGDDIQRAFQQWMNHPQITLARTAQNSGFIGACQLGATLGQAPHILFLNSDTEAIEPGWLEKMMPAQDDIAIVGAQLLYPPHVPGPLAGTIQHAGVARKANGVPYHPFIGWPADTPEANVARDVNAVTGGCLLIRRAAWNELGGWDARFGKGVYEDVDLCWRARQKGYRVLYQPAARLYHHESASKAADGHHALNEHTQANLKQLREKWPHLISDEVLFVGEKTARRWDKARKQLERAQAALQQKNVQTARAALRKALEVADDLPEAHLTYAQLLTAHGDHASAAEHLQRALQLVPAAWTLRLQLVDAWQAAQQPEKAATALQPLLAVFPTLPEMQERAAQLAAYLPSAAPPASAPAPQFSPAAVATVQFFLSQPDIAMALQQHAARLTPEVLALVRLNADTARADGNSELATALDNFAAHIQRALEDHTPQKRAAITFQRLLEADDVAAALDENRAHLDIALLELIHANALTAQAEGNAELVEGLEALAEHIGQMVLAPA